MLLHHIPALLPYHRGTTLVGSSGGCWFVIGARCITSGDPVHLYSMLFVFAYE
jgi:hypothetical protein